MFDSILGALSSEVMAFKIQVIVFVILGTIALVLLGLLLDLIKKYIRGLDTAALGIILIIVGKIAESRVVKGVSELLYLIGGTLIVSGIILFIIIKSIRHKRRVRKAEKEREMAERDRAAKAVLTAQAQVAQAQAAQAQRGAQMQPVSPERRGRA